MAHPADLFSFPVPLPLFFRAAFDPPLPHRVASSAAAYHVSISSNVDVPKHARENLHHGRLEGRHGVGDVRTAVGRSHG